MMKADTVPNSPPNADHIMARETLFRLKSAFGDLWAERLVQSLSEAEKAELLQALKRAGQLGDP